MIDVDGCSAINQVEITSKRVVNRASTCGAQLQLNNPSPVKSTIKLQAEDDVKVQVESVKRKIYADALQVA